MFLKFLRYVMVFYIGLGIGGAVMVHKSAADIKPMGLVVYGALMPRQIICQYVHRECTPLNEFLPDEIIRKMF